MKYFCSKCQRDHNISSYIGQDHRDIIGNKEEIKRLESIRKYRVEIDIETTEKIDETCIEGSWLCDDNFEGVITKIKIIKQ